VILRSGSGTSLKFTIICVGPNLAEAVPPESFPFLRKYHKPFLDFRVRFLYHGNVGKSFVLVYRLPLKSPPARIPACPRSEPSSNRNYD
jgi:hypothetical protein